MAKKPYNITMDRHSPINPQISNPFPLTLTIRRVVHLSHIIETNIPRWPDDPEVEFETVATLEKEGYYLRRFFMGEHSATHVNSPNSFYSTGLSLDQYPASSLIAPAVVIDIRPKAVTNPDYLLQPSDILNWEQQYGQIPHRSIVLLYTGWQSKWQDAAAFLNSDTSGILHFPGMGCEAIQLLLLERQIAGVGIDTHGIDGGMDATFAVNRLVLQEPRIVLENLTNLDQLPPRDIMLVIGLLRLKGGTGSPAAVLALIP